mmetsp:Transcript_4325/g.9814  ORF Transcript_4325/g.9814 Transcript_4325/m.9814 type:complete len:277 (+) Transcript_4325:117-947(+)
MGESGLSLAAHGLLVDKPEAGLEPRRVALERLHKLLLGAHSARRLELDVLGGFDDALHHLLLEERVGPVAQPVSHVVLVADMAQHGLALRPLLINRLSPAEILVDDLLERERLPLQTLHFLNLEVRLKVLHHLVQTLALAFDQLSCADLLLLELPLVGFKARMPLRKSLRHLRLERCELCCRTMIQRVRLRLQVLREQCVHLDAPLLLCDKRALNALHIALDRDEPIFFLLVELGRLLLQFPIELVEARCDRIELRGADAPLRRLPAADHCYSLCG